MPSFRRGDVVRVPFPYTNRDTRQHRPALVVSEAVGDGDHLLWVLMITSAGNRGWSGDIPLSDGAESGLPAPSIIRTTKIATIEAAQAERMGQIPAAVLALVQHELAAVLGLQA